MKKDLITLGIETSCDDTAVALLKGQKEILSEIVSSQVSDHAVFGGVVPEYASRMHMEVILPLIKAVLNEGGIDDPSRDLDLLAVTYGPGLMGSLMVGVMTAKGLSQSWDLPIIGVNHLEGHIFANVVKHHPELSPPFLSMIVSGGHTEIILVRSYGDYELLGATRDDAAGEAFDKVAKLLGLGYPGGPLVDRAASAGAFSIDLPVPMKDKKEIAFSFSGLKTAVLWEVRKYEKAGKNVPVNDICASFQKAAVESLVCKLELAYAQTGISSIALSGGVAANSFLRERLQNLASSKDLDIFLPPISYCTDNAVMIAAAGYNAYMRGERSDILLSPSPSLLITSNRKNN